jgi:hypothetical protein
MFSFLACAVWSAETFEMSRGKIKLVLDTEAGSFSLYRLSDVGKNRYEPLFDDRDVSATSWFSVLSNSRVFKLRARVGKPVVFSETESGAKFTFNLTDDFQVEQDFSFVTIPGAGAEPFVAVDTHIENTSGKTGVFALKALIDTSLGESEGIHFSTDVRHRISAETRIKAGSDRDSWIVSANKALSFAMLRSSGGASLPDALYFANWDRLNTLAWSPDFVEGRSFNTIYSVNDSAILAVWPETEIRANERLSVRMILGSWDGKASTVSSGQTYVPRQTEPVPMQRYRDKDAREAAIKALLDRIDEIEKNPQSVSQGELDRLNAELDAILRQTGE